MHRFLVVGCGGSGGATLRFLMDQLKADLAASGVEALPAAWQFVHVDVPIGPDGGPGTLGSVPEQGGTYCSLSKTGTDFAGYRASLESRFRTKNAANALASWIPEPAKVHFSIQNGAGQYRAVGRVLTLAQASNEIMPALQNAWTMLQNPDVHREMQSLIHESKVPGLGEASPGEPPLIFVVSSMAGGSGASMVLDIARLLSMIEGVNPNLIAMFLYSPDVFESLPAAHRPGVEANSAAALAELIAMQASASDEPGSRSVTDDPFRALGLTGLSQGTAFGRVIPIGRRIGFGGAILGDGQAMTIYRAVGRGLAALMLAGEASDEFADYDLGNKGGVTGERSQFGWGVPASNVAWGSFGFASLSLGRDRYSEYAAQRLSRMALDRLAIGHIQSNDQRDGTEQVGDLVANNINNFYRQTGLAPGNSDVKNWFGTSAIPLRALDQLADGIARTYVDPLVQPHQAGDQVGEWLRGAQFQIGKQSGPIHNDIDRATRRWAKQWHSDLANNVEREIGIAIANFGLPYGVALLGTARGDIEGLANALQNAASVGTDPTRLPADKQRSVDQLMQARGTVSNAAAIAELLRGGYRLSIRDTLRLRAAWIAAEILRSLAADMVQQLEFACRDALKNLERARSGRVESVGLARLRTDEYAAWPRDGEKVVPERFEHAENEVLLTTSADFPAWFDAHMTGQAVGMKPEDLRTIVATRLILGEWETVGGQNPPRGLVEARATWRPKALSFDPDSGQPIVASPGKYVVHTAADEVLDRARQYVNRPEQPFSNYTKESLYDFIAAKHLTDSERKSREDLVVNRFRQALALARPVVGLSKEAIEHLHGGESRQYKFGPVPLEGLPIVRRLEEVLGDTAEGIDATSIDRLRKSLTEASNATRIDIFGSYPSYFPIVFTSFLQPIAARWASTEDYARNQFWEMRRARPVAEALPMGQAQRRALVGGWLIGRVTGQIVVPEDIGKKGAAAVSVWDTENNDWLTFPHPLLVPREKMRGQADAVVAVLESMVLAIAACHDSRDQAPLRPYTALRRLMDDGQQGPTTGAMDRQAGATHIARWLVDGSTRSGRSILDSPSGSASASTEDERRERLLEWIKTTRQQYTALEQQYQTRIDNKRLLAVDLTADYLWALMHIEDFVLNPVRLSEPEQEGDDSWIVGPNT